VRACRAIPGLAGYVGVDLILTPGGPLVVELNPRLTTSYLGLRAATRRNLAAAAIAALEGRRPAAVRFERTVRFDAGGRVRGR
jgi:predicted ATP-grasp superfamily ATP-dependent carboligase